MGHPFLAKDKKAPLWRVPQGSSFYDGFYWAESETAKEGFSHSNAIHGGGHNAASITGAFSTGEESLEADGLGVFSAKDADGRGRAGLHTGEQGIGVGKAVEFAVENGQGAPEGIQYITGQTAF